MNGNLLIGIGAITSPIMIFLLGIIQIVSSRRADKRTEKVAKVAADVSAQAAEQSGKILVLADKTHTLVNSQYGIALALIYEKAKRIAEISNLPEDIAEVERANA